MEDLEGFHMELSLSKELFSFEIKVLTMAVSVLLDVTQELTSVTSLEFQEECLELRVKGAFCDQLFELVHNFRERAEAIGEEGDDACCRLKVQREVSFWLPVVI